MASVQRQCQEGGLPSGSTPDGRSLLPPPPPPARREPSLNGGARKGLASGTLLGWQPTTTVVGGEKILNIF